MELSTNTPAGEITKIAAFAGTVLCLLSFIDLLLPWQKVSITFYSASRNGLHGFGIVTLLALIGVVAGHLVTALVLKPSVERRVIGFAMVLCSMLLPVTTLFHVVSASEFRTFWQWLGLLLSFATGAVGVLVGGLQLLLTVDEDDLPLLQAIEIARGRGFPARGMTRPHVSSTTGQPDDASGVQLGTPPAGWYDDPDRPGGKRWWDGSRWSITDREYPGGTSGSSTV